MWLIFGTDISHRIGAWATKFQISNSSFNKVITKKAYNIKISYRTLVSIIGQSQQTHRSTYFN